MTTKVGGAADGDLRVGAWVRVENVQSKPNLNGRKGVVFGLPTPEQRWPISVSGGTYPLKAQNHAQNFNGLADPVKSLPC